MRQSPPWLCCFEVLSWLISAFNKTHWVSFRNLQHAKGLTWWPHLFKSVLPDPKVKKHNSLSMQNTPSSTFLFMANRKINDHFLHSWPLLLIMSSFVWAIWFGKRWEQTLTNTISVFSFQGYWKPLEWVNKRQQPGPGRVTGCCTTWILCFSGSVRLLPLQDRAQLVPKHRAADTKTSLGLYKKNTGLCIFTSKYQPLSC